MRGNLTLHACMHNKCDRERAQARTSDNVAHNCSLKLCLCTVAVCHGDTVTHCSKCICEIIVSILKMVCLSKAADGES